MSGGAFRPSQANKPPHSSRLLQGAYSLPCQPATEMAAAGEEGGASGGCSSGSSSGRQLFILRIDCSPAGVRPTTLIRALESHGLEVHRVAEPGVALAPGEDDPLASIMVHVSCPAGGRIPDSITVVDEEGVHSELAIFILWTGTSPSAVEGADSSCWEAEEDEEGEPTLHDTVGQSNIDRLRALLADGEPVNQVGGPG